ncbi:MAG: efflux RND transporter periplasmic adaptor subunit [Bacteroidales bacterium]|nr:efflux RND transporter periplasmic adaptor subunit [Bacteroidales bacterium]
MYKIIHIIIYFGLIAGLLSCSGIAADKKPEAPAIPVTVTNVNLTNAIFYNSYPANMVALKEVELRGQVSGYITGIYFTEGKQVHSGEQLYEIDRRKYQAAYEVSQSNVKIAEDNLEKVQRDADRYTDLAKQDAVAKQTYDNAMTDLKNAKQKVDAENSELIKAKTDFEYSLIKAPFDGTIGFSNVKMGTLITPGQTLLNTISSDDPMGVDFEINETELNRFQQLENIVISKNDTTFRIALADNSIYPYTSKISVIDRAVDPQTGTIRVRITVPNHERMLKPGMSCKVLVMNANAGQQLLIPFKAVVEQLGEYFVFTVKDKNVKQVKVSLGPRISSNVIVVKGLTNGETIVVDGIQKLHNGSVITIASSSKQ